MRGQRRIRAVAAFAVALAAALTLGWYAAENRRGVEAEATGAAGAESARRSQRPPGEASDPAPGGSGDASGRAAAAAGSEYGVDGRPPDGDPDAARRSGDGVEPILLDPIGGRGVPAFGLTGSDPEGPRDLLAWRVKRGRVAIVARGASESDGSLHFPEIVAPRDGIEVVVTAADSVPGLPGASEPQRLAARDPQAPGATALAAAGGGVRLRILPREATGDVLLANSYGVVLASFPVPNSPLAAHRVVDVSLEVTGSNAVVMLAHEFRDGRTSDWAVLELPAPEVVAD